jgi:hypothetical protein
MFGAPKTPAPPPPPAPPANPPTYASVATMGPENLNVGRMGGAFGSSILTGPLGALDENRVQRKTLLGQ